MKHLILLLFLSAALSAAGQRRHIPDMQPAGAIDNLAKEALFNDPHTTSVLLWINGEVKLHKHAAHSEHVVVVSGRGTMTLGEETFEIRKGDLIFIPEGTPHKVVVKKGVLKVISIQSPQFDGTDRIPLE